MSVISGLINLSRVSFVQRRELVWVWITEDNFCMLHENVLQRCQPLHAGNWRLRFRIYIQVPHFIRDSTSPTNPRTSTHWA